MNDAVQHTLQIHVYHSQFKQPRDTEGLAIGGRETTYSNYKRIAN